MAVRDKNGNLIGSRIQLMWVALADPEQRLDRSPKWVGGSQSGDSPIPQSGMLSTSEQFQRLMADHGIICSMSRSGDVWDNAAMESFFSSLKTERTTRKVYRTRDDARADVFDYIERFYNARRRHSTLGYLSPVEFEERAMLA